MSSADARSSGLCWQEGTREFYTSHRETMAARTVKSLHAEVPPRVDYRLTGLGESLGEAVCRMWRWVETHLQAVERSRRSYDTAASVRPVTRWSCIRGSVPGSLGRIEQLSRRVVEEPRMRAKLVLHEFANSSGGADQAAERPPVHVMVANAPPASLVASNEGPVDHDLLQLKDVDKPAPKINGVLIAIHATTVPSDSE